MQARCSPDFTHYLPWCWNSFFFSVSSSWEECSAFSAAEAIRTIFALFRSTRYPSLLGGQRQCGFKACPRLLRIYYIPTLVSGIEPQTFQSVVRRLYQFGHALLHSWRHLSKRRTSLAASGNKNIVFICSSNYHYNTYFPLW